MWSIPPLMTPPLMTPLLMTPLLMTVSLFVSAAIAHCTWTWIELVSEWTFITNAIAFISAFKSTT